MVERSERTGQTRRERMPVAMMLVMALAAIFGIAWVVGGVFAIGAYGLPATVWIGLTVLGLLVNGAVVVGIVRRATWAQWLVAMQALVLIVCLAVQPVDWGIAGILAIAVQCVLLVVPASNRWFRGGPSRTRASSPARVAGGERGDGQL